MRAISCGRIWRDQALSENILYFAYGSNLNQEDLNEWKAKKPRWENTDLNLIRKSIGFLSGYRLGFTRTSPSREDMGVADIVRSYDPMSRVWGVIFSLADKQAKAIEAKEGFVGLGDARNSYNQIKVQVTDAEGAEKPCLTYQAVVPDNERNSLYFRPSKKYYEVIRKGGEDHKLPREFFYHLRMVCEAEWVV